MSKKKLLYVAPHISTGGMPQYLLEQIKTFKEKFEVFVIEYSNVSDDFVVQKNQIRNLIPFNNFFTLGENKFELINILHKIKPDIVHFQEPPDWFIDSKLIKNLFSIPDRPYYIVTPHSKNALPDQFQFVPDRYVLVSKWSHEIFSKEKNVSCDIWEYPIKDFTPKKDIYKKELNFSDKYFHVLNVGLFTPGKNQGELFKIAENLQNKPIKFHFVGNQAGNFSQYWEPLMKTKPDNCIVWGERNDVHKFLQASDLFYFSSNLELFPIVIRESLSYKLPILMKKLETYSNTYDNNDLITFIGNDIKENSNILLKHLGL